MGAVMGVIGIKPADDKWKKMKAIWDACEAADINTPDEVWNYFAGLAPDPKGVVVHEDELKEAVQEYSAYAESGYEIHLDKIPSDIKIIRVTNSW